MFFQVSLGIKTVRLLTSVRYANDPPSASLLQFAALDGAVNRRPNTAIRHMAEPHGVLVREDVPDAPFPTILIGQVSHQVSVYLFGTHALDARRLRGVTEILADIVTIKQSLSIELKPKHGALVVYVVQFHP